MGLGSFEVSSVFSISVAIDAFFDSGDEVWFVGLITRSGALRFFAIKDLMASCPFSLPIFFGGIVVWYNAYVRHTYYRRGNVSSEIIRPVTIVRALFSNIDNSVV